MPLISVRLLLKMMAERSYLESVNLKFKKKKKDVCNCSSMGKTEEGSGSCIFASQQMVKLRNFYYP